MGDILLLVSKFSLDLLLGIPTKIFSSRDSDWYGMKDNWEYRYEMLLETIMKETPGGFTPPSMDLQVWSDPLLDLGFDAGIEEVN